jgi:hypothetical protein
VQLLQPRRVPHLAQRLGLDLPDALARDAELLANQPERVERAVKNVYAIHARIGHAEGPQIPDPRDPLWQPNLAAHVAWWKRIVELRSAEGCDLLPICPEFGPPPYMTLLPHTKQPIADLWEINCFMRDWLKRNL